MRTIIAKFSSKCAATGQRIKKGEICVYDPENKKVYKEGHEPKETDEERERRSIQGYIEAQEQAWYDNQYRR